MILEKKWVVKSEMGKSEKLRTASARRKEMAKKSLGFLQNMLSDKINGCNIDAE